MSVMLPRDFPPELYETARKIAQISAPWVTDPYHVFTVELAPSPAERLRMIKRELSEGLR